MGASAMLSWAFFLIRFISGAIWGDRNGETTWENVRNKARLWLLIKDRRPWTRVMTLGTWCPGPGNAAESNEQDPEREFSGVRHLLVGFLAREHSSIDGHAPSRARQEREC